MAESIDVWLGKDEASCCGVNLALSAMGRWGASQKWDGRFPSGYFRTEADGGIH
jgi:hypothetical protein